MKVAHCLGWYFPDSCGGTEVYVRALVRHLEGLGTEGCVMAPWGRPEVERYAHEGVSVIRYPVPEERSAAQREGRLPHARFELWEQALREQRPQVLHLHSTTYGANLHHLRSAKRQGLRTVCTVHVPDLVCPRGTRLYMGREACASAISAARCLPCWLEGRGLPRPLALAAARLVPAAPSGLAPCTPRRLRTVLEAPARLERFADRVARLPASADAVVAVCQWLYDVLLVSGVPEERLLLCRQGVEAPRATQAPSGLGRAPRAGPLRVGFFGRWDSVKGIALLVAAVRRTSRATPLRLRVYGVAPQPEHEGYRRGVMRLAAGDPRVSFCSALATDRVQAAMRDCDVVAVPSRCLETGPLVVKEALAVGTPVLGSDLGGISELVVDGVNGWLLPAQDVAAWSDRLARLAREGTGSLRWERAPGIDSNAEVAARMQRLYEGLLA